MNMRKLIMLLIFLSATSSALAQDKTIYFDENWKQCDAADASFYRVIKDHKKKQNSFAILDYYITGEIQMEGIFADNKGKIKNGEFVWYYKNGNKEKEANFVMNICLGPYKTWYSDGSLKLEGEFLKNKEKPKLNGNLRIKNFRDSLGNLAVDNGFGEYYFCSNNNKICSNGKIEKGLKQGLWQGYDESLNINFQEEYKKGKLVSGLSVDSDGHKYEYTDVKVLPNPGFDFKMFYVYLTSNIVYPIEARKHNIQGTVYIRFFVTETGELVDFKILRKLGFGCDKEALRVLQNSHKWKPGKVRGKETKMELIAPITFKLS